MDTDNPVTDDSTSTPTATINYTLRGPATVTIVYTLSEEGRKTSLLQGGDGRRFQYANVPATQAILDQATVTDEGQAYIFLNPYIPNDVIVLGSDKGWPLVKMVQAGFNFQCNRRKATIERTGFKNRGLLVPLDYCLHFPKNCSVAFDFDAPFTMEEIVEYVLAIESINAQRLQQAEILADNKNIEDRRWGGTKLAEWLSHPQLLGQCCESICNDPDGSTQVELQHDDGSSSIKVYLGPTDLTVFLAERDRRLQIIQEKARQHQAQIGLEQTRIIEERDAWIANFGSHRLQLGLAEGLIYTMRSVLNEERIAHDLGSAWAPASKPQATLVENGILNPKELHLEELRTTRLMWPDGNVRLRSVHYDSHGVALPDTWVVALLMEAPWDSDLTVINFLASPPASEPVQD
jgi:hypothetical protein